jgi:predicted dehydrogenase
VRRAGVLFTVCHPLPYAPYTRALVDVLRAGRIGDLVSVQHLEPVGAWHFRAEHRPAGAAPRCLDCAVESACPYSAPRLYRSFLADPDREHELLGAVVDEPTPEALDEALRTGPYGRCVYACDNDVADHQVVACEFAGGVTATHTVTAFTELAPRQTRVFGTHGTVEGDGHVLRVHDFRAHPDRAVEVLEPGDGRPPHEQGDEELLRVFLDAVARGDPSGIVTGIEESLTSHRVGAAERARRSGQTVRA